MKIADVSKVKVAVIQTEILFGKKEVTLERVGEYIDECAKNNAKLICLSEYFSTQLNLTFIEQNNFDDVAETIPGTTSQFLSKKAGEHGVYIAAGIVSKEKDCLYNTAILIDPKGEVIGVHKKLCLTYFERKVLTPGKSVKTYDTDIGRVGLLVGNDLNSFSVCQRLVDEDVEVVICLMQVPDSFATPLMTITEARVIDMDAFIILASNVGESKIANMNFKGISRLLGNPLLIGKKPERQEYVLAEADNREMIIYAEYDIDLFRKNRKFASRPNKLNVI